MAKGKYEKWLEPDSLLLLQSWARDGLTDEQIAGNCGITTKTLYEWKNRFGEIREALKKGKEVVDVEVENALYKRALGYDYEEIVEEDGSDGHKRRVTRKHMPPDTAACFIWLKNRKPGGWCDKPGANRTAKLPDDGFVAALKEGAEEVWDGKADCPGDIPV